MMWFNSSVVFPKNAISKRSYCSVPFAPSISVDANGKISSFTALISNLLIAVAIVNSALF